ncbi:hypothetical protein OG21DRAFT_1577621 [Imleria badia]|nr:hypothetical protein OG21DRAFT_1577621 [Imleria badia]
MYSPGQGIWIFFIVKLENGTLTYYESAIRNLSRYGLENSDSDLELREIVQLLCQWTWSAGVVSSCDAEIREMSGGGGFNNQLSSFIIILDPFSVYPSVCLGQPEEQCNSFGSNVWKCIYATGCNSLDKPPLRLFKVGGTCHHEVMIPHQDTDPNLDVEILEVKRMVGTCNRSESWLAVVTVSSILLSAMVSVSRERGRKTYKPTRNLAWPPWKRRASQRLMASKAGLGVTWRSLAEEETHQHRERPTNITNNSPAPSDKPANTVNESPSVVPEGQMTISASIDETLPATSEHIKNVRPQDATRMLEISRINAGTCRNVSGNTCNEAEK